MHQDMTRVVSRILLHLSEPSARVKFESGDHGNRLDGFMKQTPKASPAVSSDLPTKPTRNHLDSAWSTKLWLICPSTSFAAIEII